MPAFFQSTAFCKIIIVSLPVLAAGLLAGCKKTAGLLDVPVLTYLQMEEQTSSDTLTIRIGYEDGNGDIGLSPGDTFPPFDPGSQYFYNLHVEYLEKINDTFQTVSMNHPDPGGPLNFHTRISRLLGAGRDPQPITGEIRYEILLDFPLLQLPVVGDTVKLRVWIYDRDLNQSNTLESNEFILN
ncbi:MAG: hypothetical protein WD077_13010 [Bacteroidia bacterium]